MEDQVLEYSPGHKCVKISRADKTACNLFMKEYTTLLAFFKQNNLITSDTEILPARYHPRLWGEQDKRGKHTPCLYRILVSLSRLGHSTQHPHHGKLNCFALM